MKISYNSTFKMSSPHFNRLHKLLSEAIQSVADVSFARVELDRERGISTRYEIVSFLMIGKDIVSIKGEGKTLLEAIQFFYKSINNYRETGVMQLYQQKGELTAA